MANTPNFDLYKPNRADTSVEVDTSLSDNFTKIDTELKTNKDGLAGHISNPNAHTSENVSHADGSVKTTLDNHEERLGGLETDAEGLEVRVNDIETLGLDKLAPNLEGRIQTIESDVEGFLAPATFDAMDQQSYTFDEYRIGYVNNKLADIAYNVKNLGAKGDGVTDDTEFIQSAIDGLITGGTLIFPKGTYLISNRLVLKSNITLQGISAKLKLANNIPLTVSGSTNWNGATLLWCDQISNVKILNLELDGNQANQQSTPNGIFNGIQIKGCENITIDGCYIHDMQYLGIQVSAIVVTAPQNYTSKGVWNLRVTNNTFSNVQQSLQVTESDSHHIFYRGNNVSNCYGHGLSTYPGVSYVVVTDNIIKDIGLDVTLTTHGAGIRLFEILHAVVSNNIVENPRIHGIYVNTNSPVLFRKANHVTISNNTVLGGAGLGKDGDGIAVNGDNVNITNNSIFDFTGNTSACAIRITGDYCNANSNIINNAKNGINLNGLNACLNSNSIIDTLTYGVVVGVSSASSATITGNSILAKNTTILVGLRIQNNSTGTVLSSNKVTGSTTSLQDTGVNTQINDVPAPVKKYSNYTIVSADNTILASASSAPVTLTLPDATTLSGRTYVIKKFDTTANTVTIATTASQTIDGAATNVLSSAYAKVKVQSDGANWWIV